MRIDSVEMRKKVWDALLAHGGKRDLAAKALGKSVRTLNRYITQFNLFDEMDRAGLIQHAGPPRLAERGTSRRKDLIVAHIARNAGEIDYAELAREMYGADNEITRQRLYSALTELKAKGIVAVDRTRWFVL